jgi:hypothetical protein
MADQNEVDLDSVIDRLLEVRGSRPGKQVQLLEAEIRYLCTKAREIFISQPILLELEAPIKVSTALAQTSSPSDLLTLNFCLDLRRHSRTILRSPTTLRVRRIPPRGELPVPWRLRGSRQTVAGNYLPPSGVQDQIPGEFLHPSRQPRMRFNQPHLWLLRRVQEEVQYQTMEDLHRLLQLLAHRGNH